MTAATAVLLGVLLALAVQASPSPAVGDIFTVAGTTFLGDGGPAIFAQLRSPSGMAVDNAGNLFTADSQTNRVRKVDTTTGVITTVVGSTYGFSGDGELATSAKLAGPFGVAVDSAGNVFIADTNNHRIRKVDAMTGVITTVAGIGTFGFSGDGGPVTSAQLNSPMGVAVDSAGNVFIADYGNSRIRKVDAMTGVITTVAGIGTFGFSGDGGSATNAQLNFPFGVAVDSAGNLFIADYGNSRIRKVDVTTGVITTVAGSTFGFSGDGGPAISAQLKFLSGVTVDSAGNLFIADPINHRIRKVDAMTGVITTVAGTGAFGFSGDGGPATSAKLNRSLGVAVDSAGNVFIADTENHRIRKVDAMTGVITTAVGGLDDGVPAIFAQLNLPAGVAVDSAGNLFIADLNNHRVRKVDAITGVITTVAGTGTFGFSGDGGPATAAKLNNPHGVAVDSAGNVFIAHSDYDTDNHRIRKVDATTGVITSVAGSSRGYSGDGGPATSAKLNVPHGVAVDNAGNVFIADTENHRIRKVNATTGVITTMAGSTVGFSGDGGPATSAQLNFPFGVAVDSAGNLFIADTYNSRIRKVDATTGVIATVAGSSEVESGDGGPATSAWLNSPIGVAIDHAGNLFIADSNENRIRKVDAMTGIITTVAGTGTFGFSGDGGPATAAKLSDPAGVAVDSAGNVFIADYGNNRIRKVEGVAAALVPTPTPTPVPGVSGPGLAIMAGLLLAVSVWAIRRQWRKTTAATGR